MCDCMKNTNPFQHTADLIPAHERPALIQAVDRTYGALQISQQDLELMFRVWNTYVSPLEPENINCKGCRTKVVGKLRNITPIWQVEIQEENQ